MISTTKTLFNSGSVDSINLVDYLNWVSDKNHPNYGVIALPPIQRSPVWKPVQIIDLWDSLLRGMPLGSLILGRANMGDKIIKIGSSRVDVEKADKEGFFLIDGQQRTLAILLGYCDHLRACLWIDFGQFGKNSRFFSLNLTTDSQPFGFDQNDPSRKLSVSQRHKAREDFLNKNHDFKDKYDHQFPLSKTEPYQAMLPVKMIDVWKCWRDNKNDKQWWNNIFQEKKDINVDDVVKHLSMAFKRLDDYEIPLILVHESLLNQENKIGNEDALETLFRRIGTGGTTLSGEELIFSLIKHHWPEAHDTVYGLYNEEIGQILKPTEIVMTAIRLARANAVGIDPINIDIPKPKVIVFRRWLDATENNTLLEALKHLTVGENSRLKEAFKRMRKMIDYEPNVPNDPGLPKVILPHLDLLALQVVLRWIDLNHKQDDKFFENNRMDILRFILFCKTAVYNEDEATIVTFKMVKLGAFPGKEIGSPADCSEPSCSSDR